MVRRMQLTLLDKFFLNRDQHINLVLLVCQYLFLAFDNALGLLVEQLDLQVEITLYLKQSLLVLHELFVNGLVICHQLVFLVVVVLKLPKQLLFLRLQASAH